MYKLTYKLTILEEYRDRLSFGQSTSAEIIENNHLINVANGNILDSGNTMATDDPYIRNCWIIYKDRATAEMLFDENSKAVPNIYQSLEGFHAYDIVWSDV